MRSVLRSRTTKCSVDVSSPSPRNFLRPRQDDYLARGTGAPCSTSRRRNLRKLYTRCSLLAPLPNGCLPKTWFTSRDDSVDPLYFLIIRLGASVRKQPPFSLIGSGALGYRRPSAVHGQPFTESSIGSMSPHEMSCITSFEPGNGCQDIPR